MTRSFGPKIGPIPAELKSIPTLLTIREISLIQGLIGYLRIQPGIEPLTVEVKALEAKMDWLLSRFKPEDVIAAHPDLYV